VLALAEKALPDQPDAERTVVRSGPLTQEEPETDLTFVGFVGLADRRGRRSPRRSPRRRRPVSSS